jgi:iron complex outermembrane receptor protein
VLLKLKLILSVAILACLTQPVFAQQASQQSSDSAGAGSNSSSTVAANETVIVTGSRGQPRTVTSSPAPIDVIGAGALNELSGGEPLRDELSDLLPSFQSQDWVGSSSWNSIIRPAGLRGLGGADVLVLVNGKRRHNGALLDLSTGNLDNGADPVDLDLIPDAAIDHIEVLRDGASAQYGSDAIAGVINIILKKGVDGGDLNLHSGLRYAGDGATYGA